MANWPTQHEVFATGLCMKETLQPSLEVGEAQLVGVAVTVDMVMDR